MFERLPAQYVYTATPYANVFIDYKDEDDHFRHFINVLDRPPNYMGIRFLTDENNQNPHVKRFTLGMMTRNFSKY